jgi:hypothetical protein
VSSAVVVACVSGTLLAVPSMTVSVLKSLLNPGRFAAL